MFPATARCGFSRKSARNQSCAERFYPLCSLPRSARPWFILLELLNNPCWICLQRSHLIPSGNLLIPLATTLLCGNELLHDWPVLSHRQALWPDTLPGDFRRVGRLQTEPLTLVHPPFQSPAAVTVSGGCGTREAMDNVWEQSSREGLWMQAAA